MMSEDFEQLDEISKNTLRSYVKKAGNDLNRQQKALNVAHKSDDLAGREYHSGKIHDRETGIDRAKKRLAK